MKKNKFLLAMVLVLTMNGILACSFLTRASVSKPIDITGFWAEQQNWWIFQSDGEFRYGKLKDSKISAYICGRFEWKNGELIIHDSLGNDLVYDAAIRGDTLSISSSNGLLQLVKKTSLPIDDRCQSGN